MHKKADTAFAAIQARVQELGVNIRSSVVDRIEIGRCIVALRTLTSEVDATGRPCYSQAKEQVRKWLGSDDIAESAMTMAVYVSLRASTQQVKILAQAGASFTAIHAAVQQCKASEFVRFVAAVRRRQMRPSHYLGQVVKRRGKIKSKPGTAAGQKPDDECDALPPVDIHLTGGETEAQLQSALESLLGYLLLRRGLPVAQMYDEAMQRIVRLQEARCA